MRSGSCSALNVFDKILPAGFCAEMNSANQQGRAFSGKRRNLILFLADEGVKERSS